jgi:hypothetical protein
MSSLPPVERRGIHGKQQSCFVRAARRRDRGGMILEPKAVGAALASQATSRSEHARGCARRQITDGKSLRRG